MKIKRIIPMTGKLLCGISLSLVWAAVGQDTAVAEDPFAPAPPKPPIPENRPIDQDPFATMADPFASNPRIFRKGRAAEVLKGQEKQVSLMIEMIEVDHLVANEMVLEFSKRANDVGNMRAMLIDLVAQGEAKLQETLWGRSPLNEVGKVEAVVEKIYPTEYEPPELPQIAVGRTEKGEEGSGREVSLSVDGPLYTGATPSAFDTRNIGTTLEFEVAESANQPGKLGCSIYLQVSRFLQDDHFLIDGKETDARGTANIIMPRFSSVTHEFLATVVPGKHALLGIFKDGGDASESKRVIVLMHADIIAKE